MCTSATRHQPSVNHVSGLIVTAAMKVHSALGPGLLESAYHACLAHELRKQGLRVASEVPLPVTYDAVTLDVGYRMDLVVENLVVVELKCVESFSPIHEAQLLVIPKIERLACWPFDQFSRSPPTGRHQENGEGYRLD